MCVVCILFNKDKINVREAKKALWEVIDGAKSPEEIEHMRQFYTELIKIEDTGEIK